MAYTTGAQGTYPPVIMRPLPRPTSTILIHLIQNHLALGYAYFRRLNRGVTGLWMSNHIPLISHCLLFILAHMFYTLSVVIYHQF